MKAIKFFTLLMLFSGIVTSTSFAQRGRIDIFKDLKPGQWVDIAGAPQKSGPLLTEKVKVVTGDLQADDCEVKGVVTGIDPEKKMIFLHGLKISTTDDTEYEADEPGGPAFTKFAHLKVDQLIEAEGIYLKNGSFKALEVENESYSPKAAKNRKLISLVGKVQKVNPSNRTIQVMNLTFKITENTKLRRRFQ